MTFPDHGELYTRYLQGDPETEEIVEDMAKRERSSEMTSDQRTMLVLAEVFNERQRQFELWGDQRFPFHHPVDSDGHGAFGGPYESMAQAFKDVCDARRDVAQQGGPDTRSNALVLLEEVFEALAETEPSKIRTELIQVAAVAVKAIETLDQEQR